MHNLEFSGAGNLDLCAFGAPKLISLSNISIYFVFQLLIHVESLHSGVHTISATKVLLYIVQV